MSLSLCSCPLSLSHAVSMSDLSEWQSSQMKSWGSRICIDFRLEGFIQDDLFLDFIFPKLRILLYTVINFHWSMKIFKGKIVSHFHFQYIWKPFYNIFSKGQTILKIFLDIIILDDDLRMIDICGRRATELRWGLEVGSHREYC